MLRQKIRQNMSNLLSDPNHRDAVSPFLHDAVDCTMQLPARIGDYTDFYTGIHHANNIGKQFRPDSPLLPNYKHVPIGYHGRASSIRVSGADVVRPSGQTRLANADAPQFGPSRRLDYELELGLWVGQGNRLGEPIAIGHAAQHIAGYSLLNDWSARDIQAWEYQPLGPFLAKNFLSTISPWIITAEALAPFRVAQPARPQGDPQPLPYLWDDMDQRRGALSVQIEVYLQTAQMRAAGLAPVRLSLGSATHMYWTPAQLIAHHSSNGCDLQPGDLLGTGTISSPDPSGFGSLMELSIGGSAPLTLPNSETRSFLEDGDVVTMRAKAEASGFRSIGFGVCSGEVLPAIK
jgi:fumarylacetoacetase